MALRKAGISLTLEGQSAYKAGLAEINREQRLMAEQSKLAVAQLGTQASRQQTYSTSMDNYSKRIQSAADKTEVFKNRQKELPGIQNQISKSIKDTNSAYQDSARETDRLKNNYDQMRKALGSNNEETQKAKAAYQASKEETKSLGTEIKNLEKAYNSNEKELSNLPFSLNKAELATQQLRNEAQKLHDEYRNAGGRLAETAENYQKFGNTMTNVGGQMQNIGGKLTTGITLPLAGITAAALTVGIYFEKQMSRVGAIAGATADELKQLTDQAKELGASTAFSASEVAAGMENMASAGFATTEILAAMPGVLDLAAVSGGDVALASEAAATAVRAFNLEASDTGHVADVFARAAADTNAEVADMAEAMKYAAPMANTLGMSIEDTAAAIGIMSDAGIKGSQAGTTLRGAFTRLVKPTSKASDAMTEFGTQVFDSQGQIKPMAEIVSELQDSLTGMTSEQKASTLATIFGQEAMSGMMTLVEAGPDKVNELSNSLVNSAGAADEMAKVMQDNAAGAIDEMMGALETAGIEITQLLAPVIRDLAGDITELVGSFSELDDETQQNIIKWAALAMAGGPVLSMLGNITSGFGIASKGVGSLIKQYGKLTTPKLASDMATSFTAVAGGATGTATKVAGLIGTIGGLPVVLGIAGAALLGWTAWKVWGEDAWEASQRTKQWGTDVGEEASNALTEFQNLSDEASLATDLMSFNIEEGTTRAVDAYNGMAEGIKEDIQTTIAETEEGLAGLPESVKKIVAESMTAGVEEQTKLIGEIDEIQAAITGIYENALAENREVTEAELTVIENYHARLAEIRSETLQLSAEEQKKVQAIMTEDLKSFSAEQLRQRQEMLAQETTVIQEGYDEQAKLLEEQFTSGVLGREEYNSAMAALNASEIADLSDIGMEYLKVWQERGDIPLETQKKILADMGLSYDEIQARLDLNNQQIAQSNKYMAESSKDASEEVRKANDTWNGMILDEKTGEVKTNLDQVITEASQSEEGWANLQFIAHNAELDTNAKEKIMDALMANGMWWEMDFPTQFADVETNAGQTAQYFLQANYDWESMKYEDKMAILNSTSSETLQQALIDTGVWENLSPTEKEMIMSTNAGRAAQESLAAMGIWNELTAEEKKMVVTSNSTEEAVKGVQANYTWNGTNWIPKDANVKTNAPDEVNKGVNSNNTWNQLKYGNKYANLSTNAPSEANKGVNSNNVWNGLKYGNKYANLFTNAPNEANKGVNSKNLWNGLNFFGKYANLNTNADSTESKLSSANKYFSSIQSKTRTFTLEYRTLGSPMGHAKGTNYHPGGSMIVNDQKGPLFKELVSFPNGKSFVPEGRNVLIPNAPKGTKVLKAALTKRLIPKYEKGIGYDERSIKSASSQPAVSINIEINDPVVREEQDINKISNAVVEKITLDTRLKNLFNKGRGGTYAGV